MKMQVSPSLNSVQKKINNILKKVEDRYIVNKKISILLDQWVQFNFKTQGKNVGGWPPFKYPEYGRYLPGKGWDPSAKLLQDTGRLRASHIPFYNKQSGGIGSDLPYAKFHHEGIGHLPQRRTLPVKSIDLKLMNKIYLLLENHVQRATNV